MDGWVDLLLHCSKGGRNFKSNPSLSQVRPVSPFRSLSLSAVPTAQVEVSLLAIDPLPIAQQPIFLNKIAPSSQPGQHGGDSIEIKHFDSCLKTMILR